MPQARALAGEAASRAPNPRADFDELLQLACLTLVEGTHEAAPAESFVDHISTRIEKALNEALALLDAEDSVRTALCSAAGCENLERLGHLVLALPARELAVIEEHYFRGRQLKHIAGDMRVTQGRISQIHRRALARLRECMMAPHLAEPLII
jgi:RNA polymerase sigma factor (sigma-70 family)